MWRESGKVCGFGWNGTNAVTNVRAVADFCEGVSDVCDATAVGLAVTGVNMPVAAGMAKIGTVAGSISDGINIVVDVYEGKYQNGIKRMTADFTGWVISNKIHTHNKESDMFLQKAVDKLFDSIIGNVTKDE